MARPTKTVRDLIAAEKQKREDIRNKAQAETRGLTDEERGQLKATKRAQEDLEEELEEAIAEEAEEAQEASQRGIAHSGESANRDLSEKDKKDLRTFSLVRGLRLMAEGRKLDGAEAEVHALATADAARNGIILEGFGVPAFIAEQRGQTVTEQTANPGDQGGVTVPTELNGLISTLWAKSFLGRVKARRLAGLQGNQRFLVQKTVPTIQELTEIEEMDEEEILFDALDMAPTRRGTAVPFSKQLLLQSSLDVEALILDNIRQGLDLKLNADAIAVLLAAISNANGNLLEMGPNGGAPTYESVVGLEGLIDSAETNDGQLYYLTNTKVKSKLKTIQRFDSTNGEAVWRDDNTMNGYPAITSNIVPSNLTKGASANKASALILGNFNDLYVGMWGGADFVIDNLTKAKKGQVLIVCNMFWQVKVARAKSFAGIKDILTTI